MNAFDQVLVVLLVGVPLTVLAVFLIFRMFWLWYWKVDEQVALLKHMAASLQHLEERGRPLPPPATASGWVVPATPSPHPAAARP